VFLKPGINGKNDDNGLYSQNILNMSTIMFDRQMQTTYLVGNRLKNTVKVGGGTGVNNTQIWNTRNLSRLQVTGYTSKEMTSDFLAGHPKGPTSYPAQPRPLITNITLCSYTKGTTCSVFHGVPNRTVQRTLSQR
jgi:hypothetical protein